MSGATDLEYCRPTPIGEVSSVDLRERAVRLDTAIRGYKSRLNLYAKLFEESLAASDLMAADYHDRCVQHQQWQLDASRTSMLRLERELRGRDR